MAVGAQPDGRGGGGVSPEVLRLYLSLRPEDKQRVDVRIYELLGKEESELVRGG